MPNIIEIHRAIAAEAGVACEPQRVQAAALDGRVPFVERQAQRAAETGYLFDVAHGKEADFANWLRENIRAVSKFSMFKGDVPALLPRVPKEQGE